MNGLQRFALFLTIVGAINWGLIGFFHFDLVAALLGGGDQDELLPRIIYAIVGICGLICLPLLFRSDEEV
ncbi:DUF378 domain-containing protein [Virgibacillus sp. MSP4-1]|uniref:DUF378 domain-containing protein n=1 Tax=Virgibacillus sp. MSP4-1 TaxID=2700081 RepID=UPI0003A491B2|nr:DUF378 domain-containing protein [Virgibacillus sp. MSP4-1]QHS23236.1 DUF378 domain-containing protein [Virgibacillus sp. MSP4-1]